MIRKRFFDSITSFVLLVVGIQLQIDHVKLVPGLFIGAAIAVLIWRD